MMKRSWVLGLVLGGLVTAAGEARAQPDVPPGCADDRDARSYALGVMLGERIVSSAWARIADCDRVDYFSDVVAANLERLSLRPGASNYLICRYTGTYDGVFNALESMIGTCADQCFLDGELAGELSAEIYCELSIMLGGLALADDFLRGPVEICGLNFEIGCDSAFMSTTWTYANAFGVCEPYTTGEFFAVWDQARNNQCLYSPDPDDPGIEATRGEDDDSR
jgi:hypothetical protein